MNQLDVIEYKDEINSNEKIKEKSPNNYDPKKSEESKKKLLWITILIICIVVVFALIAVLLWYFLVFKKKRKENKQEIDNELIQYEEQLKAFKPNFKIKTKPDTLTQLLMESSEIYNSTSYGRESSFSVFTKAKYDIYTLNETKSDDEEFYETKYTTTITINSLCTEFSLEKKDCELNRYLDLTIENKGQNNNLRRNEENKRDIKKAIIPICIIEHTDTNIILSVTCPETLAENLKNNIILAFENIKPSSFKGIIDHENIAGTEIIEKDDKIYINFFDYLCNDNDGDDIKNDCKTIKNITTNKDGELISSKKIKTDFIYKNENTEYIKDFIYSFEDISKQNSYFDPVNYKNNLNIIFDLLQSIMVKEKYFERNTFKELLYDLAKKEPNQNNIMRQLDDNSLSMSTKLIEPGFKDINIFETSIYSKEINLNIQNDLGLGKGKIAKAISNYNLGSENRLSYKTFNTQINETLYKFISLSKAGNKLASDLYTDLYYPLLNLREIIEKQIIELNEILSFEDLSPIFDATFSVEGLNKLPYSFVTAAKNLFNDINDLNNDILYIISDKKNILRNDISSFLIKSHDLLSYIFNNLTQISYLFSTEKSKIAEISSYYLNNTDTSYIGIIEKAKEILNNYYINEKNLIIPLINDLINNFSDVCVKSINKDLSTVEKVRNKLDEGKMTINLVNNGEEIKNVIENLYNSDIKVNNIISNVKQSFKDSINLQENGYFLTKKDLEYNNQSYGKISEQALKIAQTLDNNSLVDTIFDNIMLTTRENISALLDFMQKLKVENFTLEENVLNSEDSIFSQSSINKFDLNLENEKLEIIDFIKNENKEFLQSVNEIINSLYQKDENPEKLILILKNELSEMNIEYLNSMYNESLYNTTILINNLIENNKIMATEYLTNVKNWGTGYRTEGFENKYAIYKNNIIQVRNFIQLNLKSELMNKYKKMIDQLRNILQNVKLNSIMKKYYKYLFFSENHLKIIEDLYTNIDKYISDEIFNKKYLPIINDFINYTYNYLNEIESNLTNLYIPISTLSYYSGNNYDCSLYVREPYTCCAASNRRRGCYRWSTCYNNYYKNENVEGSNNHLNLENINLGKYFENFDILYIEEYLKISNIISSYNNILIEIENKCESIKKGILEKNINYLNNIKENLKSIKNEKLGSKLLFSSYNFYKNEINQKLPLILDSILDHWKLIFDEVNEKIDSNISKFKSPANEFYFLAVNYYSIYFQNMTINYVNSIIEQRKAEFNYTIKYYYNTFLSKINKTFSYIMNNIPLNDYPLNEIINRRIKEINESYIDIIIDIQKSEKEILKKNRQLQLLNTSETNFFLSNQIMVKNVEDIKEQLRPKTQNIRETAKKISKEDSIESTISRFYLENSLNAKEIKNIFDFFDKGTFIDLQSHKYKKLFDQFFEVELDELIINIKKSLKASNEKITESFRLEKEKYINILKDTIYYRYGTIKEINEKISSIFSNGLNFLDVDSKILIYDFINQTLDRIKSHIINETIRFSEELTSYNNNYEIIENTLNNYKVLIYDQFYSAITPIINNFYSDILDHFYKNYLVNKLDEYYNQVKDTNFIEYKFLNISFNLKKVIDDNIENIVNEYKNISKAKIDSLYNKHLQKLKELISFPTMNKTINDKINDMYNTLLLPVLKNYALYDSNDTHISAYNLSLDISNDINCFINEKIQLTKEIVEKMKGKEYNIKDLELIPPDFTLVKLNELKKIEDSFNNFTNIYSKLEREEIVNDMSDKLINNYKIFINNFIPSFGSDFFDRIIKYNEMQKIKSLFQNLKYSLTQTISYYSILCNIHSTSTMPEDLKIKILTLNNIDSLINIKTNQVLYSLNSKLNDFFNENKNYLTSNYITKIKDDANLKIIFDNKVLNIIDEIIERNHNNFEKEYMSMINLYLKDPFIEQYKKILTNEKEDIFELIERNKESTKLKLNKLSSMEPDKTLSDIENKLNETKNAIDEYNKHFESFKISDSVKQFLDEFGQNIILPKYQAILNDLNYASKDIILSNLNLNSQKFEKVYSNYSFQLKSKNISDNLTEYFKIMNKSLYNYGLIEDKYSENLNKQLIKDSRRLDNLNQKSQKVADYKIDTIFQELKNKSISLKEFTKTAFTSFDDLINDYTAKIESQKIKSQTLINKIDEEEEANRKLNELNILSNKYYIQANSSFIELKDFIVKSIYEIDNLIEKSENITSEGISKKYIEIKESFIPFEKYINETNILEFIPDFNEINGNDNINIKTKIENYSIINEFKLDIIFEEDKIKKPKVIGKIYNKIVPKIFEIKYSKKFGECRELSGLITPKFNNISLDSNINFDAGSGDAKFNTIIDIDEYTIENKGYEKKEVFESYTENGIIFEYAFCEEVEKIPEDKQKLETIKSNKTVIIDEQTL